VVGARSIVVGAVSIVVGAVFAVVEAVFTVVGAVADAGEVVVGAGRIHASSVVMALESSEPVVQVIWPTVNVRPLGVAMEPKMMTLLFAWRAVHTPPTWRATVDEIWSAVYLGVCSR
jgi:hypothetical protein